MIRALQHGYKVRKPSLHISKSVDSDADRKIVEKLMKNDSLYKMYKNN